MERLNLLIDRFAESSQLKMLVAVCVGVAMLLGAIILLVLWMKKRRQAGGEDAVTPDSYMVAKAWEESLKGKLDLEALGEVVWESVRLGNYRSYASCFLTLRERQLLHEQNVLDGKALNVPTDEELRSNFETLHHDLMEYYDPEKAIWIQGEATTSQGIFNLFINMSDDEDDGQWLVGTAVEGPLGWKLIRPNSKKS